jgi:ABC-type dipeptide/oligopeptide/nickel transport system ATPase component
MKKIILDVQNLEVSIENKTIIKNFDLTIGENEIHVLMGPNGCGKRVIFSCISNRIALFASQLSVPSPPQLIIRSSGSIVSLSSDSDGCTKLRIGRSYFMSGSYIFFCIRSEESSFCILVALELDTITNLLAFIISGIIQDFLTKVNIHYIRINFLFAIFLAVLSLFFSI